MYWAYLTLFILAVFVPDFVKGEIYSIPHERVEEILIFSFGVIAFLIFIFKEHQLAVKEYEGRRINKRLSLANRALTESYNYIGEVNRKLEMLIQVGLGLTDHDRCERVEDRGAYAPILGSAMSLLRAKNASLRFVDTKTNLTQKEIFHLNRCRSISNDEFLEMGENVNIKKGNGYVIASSTKAIGDMKCYLIVEGYIGNCDDSNNENDYEILKLLASHALFLYS